MSWISDYLERQHVKSLARAEEKARRAEVGRTRTAPVTRTADGKFEYVPPESSNTRLVNANSGEGSRAQQGPSIKPRPEDITRFHGGDRRDAARNDYTLRQGKETE